VKATIPFFNLVVKTPAKAQDIADWYAWPIAMVPVAVIGLALFAVDLQGRRRAKISTLMIRNRVGELLITIARIGNHDRGVAALKIRISVEDPHYEEV